MDGGTLVRIEDARDLHIIPSPDHPALDGTPWSSLGRSGTGAGEGAGAGAGAAATPLGRLAEIQALKQRGNAAFAVGDKKRAIEDYSQCVVKCAYMHVALSQN
jgi:hypothetical protein